MSSDILGLTGLVRGPAMPELATAYQYLQRIPEGQSTGEGMVQRRLMYPQSCSTWVAMRLRSSLDVTSATSGIILPFICYPYQIHPSL